MFRSLLFTLIIFSYPLIIITPAAAMSMASIKETISKNASSQVAVPASSLITENEGERSAGTSLTIPTGTVAYIDQNIDVDEINIEGELDCHGDESQIEPIVVRASTINISGTFRCGDPDIAFQGRIDIRLKPTEIDSSWTTIADFRDLSEDYRGIMVHDGGKVFMTGDRRKSGWVKLNQTAEPTHTTIHLDQNVDGSESKKWEVGDEIAIAPTSYLSTEAESFKITAIQGSTVTLDNPIQHLHWGTIEMVPAAQPSTISFIQWVLTPPAQPVLLDQRAEVVNLTRNILIQADEANGTILETNAPGAELGGHMMVMQGGAAFIDSVEFYKMGQAGIKGRYPFHWHIAGNVAGQYIKNSSVHKSFQRCYTIHRTNFAVVDNNTCFDFKGHGFFLEDGAEKNNQITHNIGINGKYPHFVKRLLRSDISDYQPPMGEHTGRYPSLSVFWISNPANIVKDNISAGSVGTGFMMAFRHFVYDNDGTTELHPSKIDTLEFSNNTAHSSLVGISWDGGPNGASTGNENNLCDPAAWLEGENCDRGLDQTSYEPLTNPIYTNLVAYKNSYTGIYYRGLMGTFVNSITADNGWHYWVAYNNIIKDSAIIGRSQNHSAHDQAILDPILNASNWGKNRRNQSGIVFYDGPFMLDGVQFLKFPTALESHTYNGQTYDVTAAPVGQTGGTEAFVNVSKNVAFEPDPVLKIATDDVYTNSALLRDLDGSFTNQAGGAMIVGQKSIGILPTSGCQSALTQFKNTAVCPASYSETSFTMFGGPYMWGQHFVARRSDGTLTRPLSLWQNGLTDHGTHFGIPNSTSQDIEVLQMANNSNPNTGTHSYIWVNADSDLAQMSMPVVKMIAQGKNCQLVADPNDPTALSMSSLNDLRNATQSAYYTNGDEFYVKLVPSIPSWTYNPNGLATPYRSGHYRVDCTSHVDYNVMGAIESVQHNQDQSVTISGYACQFGRYSPSQYHAVKLYARDGGVDTYLQSAYVTANLSADYAFKCGIESSKRSGFQFNVPANVALPLGLNSTVAVEELAYQGYSGYQWPNAFLDGSGDFFFNLP